ncbi:MAG: DUF1194 domain-containing protein [Rhodospirillales bacterium]|nr:DUF1194 domain-containing protein [Rhodospirillales bacterium]
MRHATKFVRAAAFAFLLFFCGTPGARAEPVDLTLVLAVDVSYSVDADEAQLQRQGYFDALVHPRVLQAIAGGPNRAIAVAYMEWAGNWHNKIVAGWTVIRDRASAQAFVDRIAAVPSQPASRTSISGAIDFAVAMLEDSGFETARRVIDVSGDGRNNQGRPAWAARDDAVARGITINGLPIVTGNPDFGRPPDEGLVDHYQDEVIGGPGAFLVVAQGFAAFTNAVLSKLVREVAGTAALDPQSAEGSNFIATPFMQ